MYDITMGVINLLIVSIVCMFVYICGFNSGYKCSLDIFTGRRKVKPNKNPFLKYSRDM